MLFGITCVSVVLSLALVISGIHDLRHWQERVDGWVGCQDEIEFDACFNLAMRGTFKVLNGTLFTIISLLYFIAVC